MRRLATILLLAVMAALLVSSSLHKRFVYDETDNVSYGFRFLTRGPGVPPLGQRMPVLALNALGCLTDGCDTVTLDGSEVGRLAVRAGSMLFALAMVVLLAQWAGQLFGPLGALAALWLAVFDPTLLAHGKQVTSDVAVAFFMTAAVYAYSRWREGPTPTMLVACALATAAAILSKFTALLLVPILALFVAVDLIRAWRRDRTLTSAKNVKRGLAWAATFAIVVLSAINAAYLFRGSFRSAASYQWESTAFRAHATWPVPIPLPRVFVQGLDYSSWLQETPDVARGYNYVLGELNRDGRWYAFPLMVLLKTPLAVFILAALGLRSPGPPGLGALLGIPFVVVLLFFSLCVQPQLGIRYVLPAHPIPDPGRGAWGGRPARLPARARAVAPPLAGGLDALVLPALHPVLQRAHRPARERVPLPGRLEPGLGRPRLLHRGVPAPPSRDEHHDRARARQAACRDGSWSARTGSSGSSSRSGTAGYGRDSSPSGR